MYTKRQIKLGNERLLRLAQYVERRQSRLKNKKIGYDQYDVMHKCGAPACLLGHARVLFPQKRIAIGDNAGFFALIEYDAWKLFGTDGCGDAKRNWRKAVKYVRQFVADREAGL